MERKQQSVEKKKASEPKKRASSAGKSTSKTAKSAEKRAASDEKTVKASKRTKKDGTESASKRDAEFRKFFLSELKDIYWAENALVKALLQLSAKATSKALVLALNDHFAVTETHVERLHLVFDALGKKPSGKKCDAMAGLIKEAQSIVKETKNSTVRDAGIISAAQKVEHYEIASYGTLVAFAKILGENKVAALLQETLKEEKKTDKLLSKLAEAAINPKAAKKRS